MTNSTQPTDSPEKLYRWVKISERKPSDAITDTYHCNIRMKNSNEGGFPAAITYSGEWERLSDDYEVIEWLEEHIPSTQVNEGAKKLTKEEINQLAEDATNECFKEDAGGEYKWGWEDGFRKATELYATQSHNSNPESVEVEELDFKNDLAIESVVRVSLIAGGTNGRWKEPMQKMFIDGALWVFGKYLKGKSII